MKRIYNNEVISRFLVLQPIIDIITSLMINELLIPISLGMIIRFLFLVYASGYLIIKRDKKIICVISILILYTGLSTIGNFILKDNFSLFTQASFILKFLYFPISLLFFYKYFKEHKELNMNVYIHASLLMTLSLVVAILTNTSYCSYMGGDFDCHLRGYLGWFNSANETSIILIFYLGMMLINYLKQKNSMGYFYLLLVAIFMILIGTKTGFIGLFGILVIYILYYVISTMINNKKVVLFKKVLILLISIIGVILYIPNTPLYFNLDLSYRYSKEQLVTNKDDNIPTLKTNNTDSEIVANHLVFNDRDDFLTINKEIYSNSNTFNKLFGITNQDNYINGIKYDHICERDLHDLIIYYGIVGFLIILLVSLYLLFKLIKNIIKRPKILLDDKFIITGIVTSLMLAVSYLAGHTLFNPAVSIYLALVITNLVRMSDTYE